MRQSLLPGYGPRAPPQHLLVEQAALRRARHDDTVDRGLVKAFGEHGAVGDDLCGAAAQALQQRPAGLQRRGAIERFGGNARRRKGLGHGIGRRHGRRKEQGFARGRVRLKGRQHLRRSIGGKQHGVQLGGDKIPPPCVQGVKIGLEQHLDGAQIGQVARLHHLHQAFLVHNLVKDGSQRLVIAALRRGGDAHHERPIGLAQPDSG